MSMSQRWRVSENGWSGLRHTRSSTGSASRVAPPKLSSASFGVISPSGSSWAVAAVARRDVVPVSPGRRSTSSIARLSGFSFEPCRPKPSSDACDAKVGDSRRRVAGASVCSGAAADGAPPAVEVRKMSNEGDLGRELSGSEVDRCVREVETSGGRSASRDSRGIALAIPSNLPRVARGCAGGNTESVSTG